MSHITDQQAHRPWPMPKSPWIMRQDWCDLLFAHWSVPAEVMRELIPRELELDLFEGGAWLGVVPFRMDNVRFRCLPKLPGLSAFPELNLRTYVRHGERPGVWFFSLDATNRAAVMAARSWFDLPYHHARMSCETRDGFVEYSSSRVDLGEGAPKLRVRYRPTGGMARAEAGSLDQWLTERYCLYAQADDGRLSRAEIQHAPWLLQTAEAEFVQNDYPGAAGVVLPAQVPLLHFVSQLEVVVWPPQRLSI